MPAGEFLLYQTEDGRTRVECRFAEETLWLTQAAMAELFMTTPQNIRQHLKAIFAEGELTPEATCKDDLQVRSEAGRALEQAARALEAPGPPPKLKSAGKADNQGQTRSSSARKKR